MLFDKDGSRSLIQFSSAIMARDRRMGPVVVTAACVPLRKINCSKRAEEVGSAIGGEESREGG